MPGDRVCFVRFSCATPNRDLLAIHACHHYDIWRRKLQVKWAPPGFETTFVTVGSANRNWSSCCGERDKEIYWNSTNKEIFLSYLSSFLFSRNREQSRHSITRICMRARVCLLSLWYIYRTIIASSNALSLASQHRPFELCRAILRLLIAVKGRAVS